MPKISNTGCLANSSDEDKDRLINNLLKYFISNEFRLERHFYHKDVYVRYWLTAEEYETLKQFLENLSNNKDDANKSMRKINKHSKKFDDKYKDIMECLHS